MEVHPMVAITAQIVGIVFLIALGGFWIVGMRKDDGKISGDEAAKASVVGVFIFMVIVNATSENMVFDHTAFLLVLGSVLALAGIDIAKAKSLLNGNRGKDSTNSK